MRGAAVELFLGQLGVVCTWGRQAWSKVFMGFPRHHHLVEMPHPSPLIWPSTTPECLSSSLSWSANASGSDESTQSAKLVMAARSSHLSALGIARLPFDATNFLCARRAATGVRFFKRPSKKMTVCRRTKCEFFLGPRKVPSVRSQHVFPF